MRAPALLALLIAACAPASGAVVSVPDRFLVTVLVVNQTLDTRVVRSSVGGGRLGWVQPGRSVCVRVPSTGTSVTLSARGVGGGTVRSPSFSLGERSGWRWTIRSSDRDVGIDLVPMSPPCGSREA